MNKHGSERVVMVNMFLLCVCTWDIFKFKPSVKDFFEHLTHAENFTLLLSLMLKLICRCYKYT